MRRLLIGRLVITIFAIVITPIPAALALENDFKKYFPLNQGNSWTYSSEIDGTDGKVTYNETLIIKGKEIVNGVETVKMFEPDGEYECIAADSEGIKIYKEVVRGKYEIFKPPLALLPNIGIGESRSYSINSDIYLTEGQKESKVKGTHWYEVTFEAVEDVEVPAGVFTDCVKLSKIFIWKIENGNHGIDTITVWLASGAGRVKILTVSEGYNVATGKRYNEIKTSGLRSAVINGKVIGKE